MKISGREGVYTWGRTRGRKGRWEVRGKGRGAEEKRTSLDRLVRLRDCDSRLPRCAVRERECGRDAGRRPWWGVWRDAWLGLYFRRAVPRTAQRPGLDSSHFGVVRWATVTERVAPVMRCTRRRVAVQLRDRSFGFVGLVFRGRRRRALHDVAAGRASCPLLQSRSGSVTVRPVSRLLTPSSTPSGDASAKLSGAGVARPARSPMRARTFE